MQILMATVGILILFLLTIIASFLAYGAYRLFEMERRRMQVEHDSNWEVFDSQHKVDFEKVYADDRSQ